MNRFKKSVFLKETATMQQQFAEKRAAMPEGTNKVLDRRSLETDNKNLLKYLNSGSSVLDVGCGSGAITRGIAGRAGKVTGIDTSESLIALARKNYGDISNLEFQVADIHTFDTTERYDIITAARVLQWLSDPKEALRKLKPLLKEGGVLAILDYNHEKIQWHPALPVEMQKFYDAFLQWRKDAGFDNAIADNLSQLFAKLNFKDINLEVQFELTQKRDADFASKAGIWSEVAKTRGNQLVKDKYITEEERLAAIAAYDSWIANEGQLMQMYLLAVEAK
ncbi:Ubiquinone/menaquinone biosynthesis C-methylase UbiE [Chitinophaga sp. CF118]|nr:Ubiquinone/menaquinone biosynthesis C-methylase UbiE [Chitinophaga sp. CF118]